MPIYENDRYHMMVIGDYRPVKVMDGSRTVFCAKEQEQSGTLLTFNDTYNDKFDYVKIHGATSQTVTEQGKNLFDGLFYNGDWNGGVVPVAHVTSTSRKSSLNFITVAPNTRYVVSWSSSSHQISIMCCDANKSKLSDSAWSNSGVTFITPSTCQYVALRFKRANDAEITLSEAQSAFALLQIEAGSTPTPYAPFVPESPSPDYPAPITGIQPQRVDVNGRNLFNGITSTGNWERQINGSFLHKISGITMIGSVRFMPGIWYCLSVNTANNSGGIPTVIVRNPSGDTSGQKANYGGSKNYVTFKFGSESSWNIHLQTDNGAVAPSVGCVAYVQIEVVAGADSLPSPYTPYVGTTIPLPDMGPIWDGGYRDYAAGADYAEWASAVISENLTMGLGTELSNSISLYFTGFANKMNAPIISNRFPSKPTSIWNTLDEEGVTPASTLDGYIRFRVNKTRLGWSSEWTDTQKRNAIRNWFSANPVTVVYQLATPVTTSLPPIDIPTLPIQTVISAEGAQITARCRVIDSTY